MVTQKIIDELWSLYDRHDKTPEFIICAKAAEHMSMLKRTLEEINNKAVAFQEEGPFDQQEAFDRITEIYRLSVNL